MNSVIETVLEVARESAKDMTSDLQDSARIAGWPSHIAAALSVDVVDTSFQISADSAAEDHEYGLPGQPPNPVLRKFVNRSSEIESSLLDNIESALKQKGIL